MRAVLQNFKTGAMEVAEVPPPALKPGGVLVANAASLISAGTEKAVIELAKMNPLQKARTRPDLVKKVLAKAGQEGLLGTARIVNNLVSAPLPLGYSCAGVVTAVGAGVTDIQPGMQVACAGLGYANHAEVIFVPRNLCTPIPEGVSFAEAAFVTVGAIAMHGVRQAELTLGESVVVVGLGLVGQLTVQICLAAGCRVFGIDPQHEKLELARQLGAQAAAAPGRELTDQVLTFTGGRGTDAVLVTAATKSSQPMVQAAELARDRARVVAVGEVGMDLPRRAYYDKEIDIRLSRSYGPGRYDPAYEEKGQDYPLGYVRWTENRNMAAFLQLVADGRLRTEPLLTHRYAIAKAETAYGHLLGESMDPYIGILLEYDPQRVQPTAVPLTEAKLSARAPDGEIRFGVIGAGQFAQGVLLPRLKAVAGVRFQSFATGSGLTARAVAQKYGAQTCTSDYRELLQDEAVDAVLIATRHDQHASMVSDALRAGKHVFVEKPLVLSRDELETVAAAYQGVGRQLLIGFNRRFSPMSRTLKEALSGAPLVMTYRINAGPIPAGHWHQDAEVGGGRIVGEVCHFIDVMQYLTGASPIEVHALAAQTGQALPADPDCLTVSLSFSDGSVGSIAYVSNGDPSFPKERLEVFGGGMTAVIDNWRKLRVQGAGRKVSKRALFEAEKGHAQELQAFVDAIRTGDPAIAFDDLLATTTATFAIQESLRRGGGVEVS
ncbi:bi-domain-containing oxidoreductase [Algihabitans albus]|uniref:bi-domain-containing oxidoreductase n=1 Tax=Algihabitans albus TaxID=2164067 RepID=UPI000E5CADEA|nr:bi-domain-containing oxidoreductase [Algihabitans albus]